MLNEKEQFGSLEIDDFYNQIPEFEDVLVEESIFSYSPEHLKEEIKAAMEKAGIVLLPPDTISFEKLDSMTRVFLLPSRIKFIKEAISLIKCEQIDDERFLCTIVAKHNGMPYPTIIGKNGFEYQDIPPILFEKMN